MLFGKLCSVLAHSGTLVIQASNHVFVGERIQPVQ
jgi:hypothetical protein